MKQKGKKTKTGKSSATVQPTQTASPSPSSVGGTAATDSSAIPAKPNKPLQITLIPPESKLPVFPSRAKKFVWAVLILIFLWLLLYIGLIAPRAYSPMKFNETPLAVTVAHPDSAAFGDEAELDLIVTNPGDQEFSGALTVIFNSNVAVFPLPSETTTIEIKNLDAKAASTHRVKFALPQQWRFFSGEKIRVGLQASTPSPAGAQRYRSTAEATIKVAPFPYLRTLNSLLFGSAAVMAIAGRRGEMKLIEEKLRTRVGLVIYGQRRIGKSSILLHLRERLPHSLLPVYLNLQQLMADTTGGFLRAVGNEIVKQLGDKLADPPAPPSAEEFDREPFLSLNQLLDEIERRLATGQRVLLSFDEFEELEQRVRAGRIEKEIFAYLRGVTQTGRGFALLFAGLHTLEQMTREYWNPFFQSVQTVRIGYLSELDARQLITDPIDRFPLAYDEEAIDRITEVTNAHPYLAQSVCHNLVNRLNDPLYRSNRATAEDVDAVLERTLESSGYYFDDYVWGWSNPDERLALALIAEAGDEANFAVVEKHLGREAALKATQSLVSRDIIAERTERDDLIFRFRIPLSRMWVRRTKSSARLLLERGIE